jgi:hypothetical protein
MSILDDVRRKYRSAIPADDPFGSNVSVTDKHLNTSPPSIQTAKHGADKSAKSPFVSYVSHSIKELKSEFPDLEPHESTVVLEILCVQEMRKQGVIPEHYTSTTTCKRCGLVPIWDGCPPKVQDCPWCFNRHSGLPIPTIKRRIR